MTVVDCDAHVEEGLETWTYLDPKFHRRLPHHRQRLPHGDAFREDHLAEQLEQRGDLSASTIEKILSGNPSRAFVLDA